MKHDMSAFDEATQLALQEIIRRGVDCFGEPLERNPALSHDRVIACLAEKPMRLRQIALRTQAKRETVQDVCERLVRTQQITRDDEAFYALNGDFYIVEPERH